MDKIWLEFARHDNLQFRAACNEAAPPPGRPVDRRVLERIVSNDDAAEVYRIVSGSSPDIVAALVERPEWRTLISEISDQIKREDAEWTGFWEIGSRIWQWFTTKPANGVPAPRDKAIAAAMTGLTVTVGAGGGIVASKKLFDDKNLTIPVTLKMPSEAASTLHVMIKPDGLDGPVPLRVSLEPSAKEFKVPIAITGPQEGLQLRLSAENRAALEQINTSIVRAAHALERYREPVTLATSSKNEIVSTVRLDTTKIVSEQQQNTNQDAKELVKETKRIADALDKGVQADVMVQMSKNLQLAGLAISGLHTVASEGRTLTTMAAAENTNPLAEIDRSDANGALETCKIEVHVGKVTSTIEIKNVKASCGNAELVSVFGRAPRHLRSNDVVRLEKIPYAIVVDRIQRPLWGPNVAVLRIISVQSRPPVEPARLAGTQER